MTTDAHANESTSAKHRDWRARAIDYVLVARGSTRSVAILRIGIALILWTRFGALMTAWQGHSLARLALSIVFHTTTALLFVGLFSRVAAAINGLVGVVLLLFLGQIHHHTYVLVLVTILLSMAPCDRSFSLDRLRAIRRADARGEARPAERGDLWATRLIGFQLSLIYLWGTYDKIVTPGYLSGRAIEQMLLYFHFGADYPAIPHFLLLAQLISFGTLAMEPFLAVALWLPRWRRIAIPLGMAFHATLYFLLPISTFTLTLWLLYIVFIPPDDVHAFIDRFVGTDTKRQGSAIVAE
jgi:hypothetical protein